MPRNLSREETRNLLIDYVEDLESLPGISEPTQRMYELHAEKLSFAKSVQHTRDRGKRLISTELNMTVSQLEALCIGKTVLDVGCGTGVLSREIAALKKTQVTALDNNPEVLNRIKGSKNLKIIEGSGFNIAEATGGEQFDVVISSYSSYSWAETADEKKASVESAIGSCVTGGNTLFIPVVMDIEQKKWNRQKMERLQAHGTSAEVEAQQALVYVSAWLDIVGIDSLLDREESGLIDCTFVSSRENTRGYILPTGALYQRYSAIAEVA